jgi:hypothetical protein
MPKFELPFKYNQPVLVSGIKFSDNRVEVVNARFLRQKDDLYIVLFDGLLLKVKPEQVSPDPKNPF